MKIFNKLRSFTQKLSKKSLVVAGICAVATGMALTVVKAEFYPDRPTYDYNKPCDTTDADIYDRCGSLTGPVFNSFINTPSYGDERQFTDARRTDQTTGDVYKNVLPDVTDGSQIVQIRMYVHNNANQNTNASGVGIAKDAKIRVDLPEATSNVLRARGYISASNADQVEDTVDFTAPGNFKMEYIAGSAMLYDNDNFASGVALNDSIVTTGAAIGSDSINGDFKGCFEYEAMVYINVRIIPEEPPQIELTKQVRKAGDTVWSEEVTTKPGDRVEWLLTNRTTGGGVNYNVISRDELPSHVSLVGGSVRWIDASQNAVQPDGPLFDAGLNVGNYATNSGFYMMFATDTLSDFEGCEVRVRNIGYVRSDQVAEKNDTADVVIRKENCVEPIVNCTSLTAPKYSVLPNEEVVFTAVGSATGTTISGYRFYVNNNLVQDSASNTYAFSEADPDNYTVRVTVVAANGMTGVSEACEKEVTVEEFPEVICTGFTGPTSIKVGETGTYTITADHEDRVESRSYVVIPADDVTTEIDGISIKVTFNETGEYIVRGTITPADGVNAGQTITCETEVTVTELPTVKCSALTGPNSLKLGESGSYTVVSTNEAYVQDRSYSVTPADGTTLINVGQSAKITFNKVGNYTVKGTITAKDGVTLGSPAICELNVTVTDIPKCIYDDKLPANDPNCKPPVIVNTGPADTLGLVASITVAAAAAHSFYGRKLNLR